MAEKARELLAQEIETLRTDVLRAGVLNAKALQASAESHVAHMNEMLRSSAALQDASFAVVTDVIAFARRLYGQAAVAESEQARRAALAAIDRLAAILDHAEWRDEVTLPAGALSERDFAVFGASPQDFASREQEVQKAV